jgi:glycosyltransferase involved in cell wall biosynthesis
VKVLFWSSGDDGSNWYRATLPAMALGWSGHAARVTRRPSASEVEQADVIVVSRPAAPGVLKGVAQMKAMGKRVFADMDDDYFAIDAESNSLAHKFWNERMLANLREGLGMCDGVICASLELAAHVWKELGTYSDEHVHVIQNGLHAGILAVPRDYSPGVITLGWAGSANTAAWLPQIARAVNLALQTNPNVRFLSVGIPRDILHKRYGFEQFENRVGVVPWAKHGDEYLSVVRNFDIWLAPYSDIPFNRAKFATKALEAGMLGIPLIASHVHPYIEWDGAGNKTSFLVKRDHEWSRYIATLIHGAQLRQQMGENARARASQNIMQSLGLRWAEVLSHA